MPTKAAKKKSKPFKPTLLGPRKGRSKRKRSRAPMAVAPKPKRAKKRRRNRARHDFDRIKKLERKVTEKTLRDILALRCVQRCTH